MTNYDLSLKQEGSVVVVVVDVRASRDRAVVAIFVSDWTHKIVGLSEKRYST